MKLTYLHIGAFVGLSVCLTAGCSKKDKTASTTPITNNSSSKGVVSQATKSNDLKEIAVLYLSYLDKFSNKSAKTVDDFSSFASDYPAAIAGLKEGRYIVCWNAEMPGDAQKIVAYEAEVPVKGGLAVTLMGEVKTLTAEDFKSATKAGSGN